MSQKFYVAACVFTEEYSALSKKICDYLRGKDIPIIRCCVDKYKVAEFEERMPKNYRDEWRAIKHFEKFPSGSVMISICHNCSAIFEERHPEIKRESFGNTFIFTRRTRIISRAHSRTEKITNGSALRPNSDGKSGCVLPLLRSRIKIGRQEDLSLGGIVI